MSWIKQELNKQDAGHRSYYLVILVIVAILLPVLLIMQSSIWFLGAYLFVPYVFFHKDLREYYSFIRKELILLACLTALTLLILLFSKNEGVRALSGAFFVLGSVLLIHFSFRKLLSYFESIGVE